MRSIEGETRVAVKPTFSIARKSSYEALSRVSWRQRTIAIGDAMRANAREVFAAMPGGIQEAFLEKDQTDPKKNAFDANGGILPVVKNMTAIIEELKLDLDSPEAVYLGGHDAIRKAAQRRKAGEVRLRKIADGETRFRDEAKKDEIVAGLTIDTAFLYEATGIAPKILDAYAESAFPDMPEESRDQYRTVLEGLLYPPTNVEGLWSEFQGAVLDRVKAGDIEGAHALFPPKVNLARRS